MFRKMYSSEFYSRLQIESLKLWQSLEKEHSVQLLSENGLLFYGEEDTGETVEGSIPGAMEVMDKLKIPYDYVNAQDISSRWPATPQPGNVGCFEKTAGSCKADVTVDLFMRESRKRGAQVMENTAVLGMRDVLLPGGRRGMELRLSNGEVVLTEKVVMAAGAWTNSLLSLIGERLDLQITSVCWGHWRVDPTLAPRYPQWFCFRKERPEALDGGLYYGFPVEREGEAVIKVGIDYTPPGAEFNPPSMDQFCYTPNPQVVHNIDTFLRENWRGIGECLGCVTSPYTMTRDQNFVLDRLPGRHNLVVFTGGSGRAFKFTPLLGRCLADLVLEKEPSVDISLFSAARPAVMNKQPPSQSITTSILSRL